MDESREVVVHHPDFNSFFQFGINEYNIYINIYSDYGVNQSRPYASEYVSRYRSAEHSPVVSWVFMWLPHTVISCRFQIP